MPEPSTEPISYDAPVQDERVHASLYTDPRIFADEMDRLFFRGWVFIGHECEIPRWVDGALRMCRKTVVLINAAEPLPNLSFLI